MDRVVVDGVSHGREPLRPHGHLPVVGEGCDHHVVQSLLSGGLLVVLEHFVKVRLYDAALRVAAAAEGHRLRDGAEARVEDLEAALQHAGPLLDLGEVGRDELAASEEYEVHDQHHGRQGPEPRDHRGQEGKPLAQRADDVVDLAKKRVKDSLDLRQPQGRALHLRDLAVLRRVHHLQEVGVGEDAPGQVLHGGLPEVQAHLLCHNPEALVETA
mmetsp:Transcript_76104/g.202108  ORF Transcript_76104/g.202108 Transcript_76104/m.202108 type:complete len:214 (-) Transcript_76104:243-884(-)